MVLVVRNLSSLERHLEHRIDLDYGVEDPQFLRTMGCLLGPNLLEGNRVRCLVNGKEYFPAMLEAIRDARESITMETFIFWSGDVGKRFTEALIERAEAGVRVHVLVDWFGSWRMDRALLNQIRYSKVEFRRYRPPYLHDLAVFNNRTHRKILVVDGRIAFCGGAGIADTWDGDAENRDKWRDNQYELTGPCVLQMQAAFMDNWIQVEAELLTGDRYFPRLDKAGDVTAQVFASGPGNGSESARIMYLLSIAAARKSILLGQGYFIPDKLSMDTIIAARRRGVRVQVIIQGPTDAPFALHCTWWLMGRLLKEGVEIYEYQPARYHVKVLVVDDIWVSVGSTNFDARSFRLNDEVNLNTWDREVAAGERLQFESDLARSRQITYEEWKARAATSRVKDWFYALFRKQM